MSKNTSDNGATSTATPEDLSPDLKVRLAKTGYILGETLGEGSYSKVKVAINVKTQTKYAMKILYHEQATQGYLEKFLSRETRLVNRFHHPNIVRTHYILKYTNFTCFVMELAEGGDLLDMLLKRGHLKENLAKEMFREILDAVSYCHSMDIAHRDLKCENILLDRMGHVKLADFGFARSCSDPITEKRVLSRTYCGSAAYCAPEVLSGSPYNPMMADAWSLGIILYIMITGRMPFDDTNRAQMLKYQKESKWDFPQSMAGVLNSKCKSLIKWLLQPDITKRASVRQVKTAPWMTERTRLSHRH